MGNAEGSADDDDEEQAVSVSGVVMEGDGDDDDDGCGVCGVFGVCGMGRGARREEGAACGGMRADDDDDDDDVGGDCDDCDDCDCDCSAGAVASDGGVVDGVTRTRGVGGAGEHNRTALDNWNGKEEKQNKNEEEINTKANLFAFGNFLKREEGRMNLEKSFWLNG